MYRSGEISFRLLRVIFDLGHHGSRRPNVRFAPKSAEAGAAKNAKSWARPTRNSL
jgi:hypothetical protein